MGTKGKCYFTSNIEFTSTIQRTKIEDVIWNKCIIEYVYITQEFITYTTFAVNYIMTEIFS